MKTYLINSSEAQYTDEELQWLQSTLFEVGIIGDKDTGELGFVVSEQDTPGMNVEVEVGKALIEVTISGRIFKVIVENTAVDTLAISSNISGSNRVDAVIIRVDKDTEPNTLKTNVGTLEVIEGTGPTALTDGAIDTAVSGDGWYRLANVTVVDSATEIENTDIEDTRTKVATNRSIEITDFLGALTNNNVTQAESLEEQVDVSTNTIEVGEADATTKKNEILQTFTATKTKINGASFFKKTDTGTFTGTVTLELFANQDGEPTGSALADVEFSNADWGNIADDDEFEMIFDTEYHGLVIGADYHLKISTSTNDNANHINLGADTSSGDASVKYNNSVDGWVAITNSILYFRALEGNEEQIVKTGLNGQISEKLIPKTKKFGSFTKDVNDTTLTTIAHGLGRVPKFVKISGGDSVWQDSTPDYGDFATMSFMADETDGASYSIATSPSSGGNITYTGSNKTFILYEPSGNGDYASGAVTFDKYNIYISWSKNGTPAGVWGLLWEAE